MGCNCALKQNEGLRKGSTAESGHDPHSTAAGTIDKGDSYANFIHASDIVGTAFKEGDKPGHANRYKFSYGKLADGTEGFVRKAYDQIEHRDVAVKCVSLSNPKSKEIECLRVQTRIMQKCDSPYIVKLYDVFEKEEMLNLVMEYAVFGDLWSLLTRQGVISERAASALAKQLLTALNYLHTVQKVVHCDVKLENVVLAKGHVAKLVDFGSSVELHEAEQFLSVGDIRGTLMYLAPECWAGIYSPASDIWALGVLLSFIMFMTVPFNAASKEEQRAKVLAAAEQRDKTFLKRLFKIRPVSGEFKDFMSRLFETKPQDRITAAEALNHPWILKHEGEEIGL